MNLQSIVTLNRLFVTSVKYFRMIFCSMMYHLISSHQGMKQIYHLKYVDKNVLLRMVILVVNRLNFEIRLALKSQQGISQYTAPFCNALLLQLIVTVYKVLQILCTNAS